MPDLILERDAVTEGENYLAHYGVLGMHWGVRKPDSTDRIGRESRKGFSSSNKEVLKAVGADEQTSARMEARYGRNTLAGDGTGLSEKQKKVLIGLGIGALAVGGVAVGVYLAKNGKLDDVAALLKKEKLSPAEQYAKRHADDVGDIANFLKREAGRDPAAEAFAAKRGLEASVFNSFVKKSEATKLGFNRGWTPEEFAKLGTSGVNLKAGSIVKRVSTVAEEDIHPGGFFAAHLDDDVNRYKAVLPMYWKKWEQVGIVDQSDSGFVVSLKAKADIKAPSVKEATKIFRDMLDETIDFPTFDFNTGAVKTVTQKVSKIIKENSIGVDVSGEGDDLVRSVFPTFSTGWVNKTEGLSPLQDRYFQKIKDAGYNALIDINDAGSIGDSPLRILDGDLFDISGTEVLSKEGIEAARKLITQLSHMLSDFGKEIYSVMTTAVEQGEDFLAHYGVLGMRWGRHLPGKESAPGQSKAKKKVPNKSTFKPGTHPEHRRAHTLDKKPVHQLSNNDLKAVNARLDLEKKYASLKSERKKTTQGYNYVKNAIAVGTTATVGVGLGIKLYNYTQSAAGKAVIAKGKEFIKRAAGSGTAAKTAGTALAVIT